MKTISTFLLLVMCAAAACRPSPPSPRPANLAARYTGAVTAAEQVDCLRDIVALPTAEASLILTPLDSTNKLLAVDDQLNCLLHSNADGTTYRVSPGARSSSNKSGSGWQIDELRWLGWSDGGPFGFPHQRYSIYAGKKKDVGEYVIYFIVFEGNKTGLNAGELRDDHYGTLETLRMWPRDWRQVPLEQ